MIRLRPEVSLQPVGLEHAAAMLRWASDPAIRRDLGLRHAPSQEHTEAWIARAQQDPSTRPFAICLAGEHVGNVVIDRLDGYIQTGRLSVYVGAASARGAGVGRTGIYLAAGEVFQREQLHKLWLTVHTRNQAAINTYSQLGFRLEGILRDEFWLDGQRADLLYMGLYADDYRRLPVQWTAAAPSASA
jgi:diamine N-acetyltransferase